MVERSLSMREARGSIPRSSNLFARTTLKNCVEDKTVAFWLSALPATRDDSHLSVSPVPLALRNSAMVAVCQGHSGVGMARVQWCCLFFTN